MKEGYKLWLTLFFGLSRILNENMNFPFNLLLHFFPYSSNSFPPFYEILLVFAVISTIRRDQFLIHCQILVDVTIWYQIRILGLTSDGDVNG